MSSPVLWYLSRGTGAVTLLLLSVTVVLGIVGQRRWSTRRLPRFVLDGLHRNVSLLVLTMLGIHVATVVIDSFVPVRLVDVVVPFVSAYRPLWVGLGALAFDLLIAIAITSALRRHLGHRAWRTVHWLAYAAWPVAVIHAVGVGTDRGSSWMLVLLGTCVLAVLVAVWTRLAPGRAAVPATAPVTR
jgi:sulfoxide reductase heme-binding subunit YedZ